MVAPLVSLQGDLIERCKKLKITCAERESSHRPATVSIVFVTPAPAMTQWFRSYSENLRTDGQLDRVVIDEVHVIFDGT